MKNSNETVGNRTRDLPTCSVVSQPTAPPAACPSSSDVRNLIQEDHARVVKLCDWWQPLRQIGSDVTFTDETQSTHECQQREEFAFWAQKNVSGSVQERNFEKGLQQSV